MKAFLSYSSRGKALVDEVAEYLGTGQIELDSMTFDSGLLNISAIQTALKRASIFVLFLTKDAIDSSYVRFEALLAQELLGKGLIEKFLVICLDPQAFSMAEKHWKVFSFVRHLRSPQQIARLIQNHLIVSAFLLPSHLIWLARRHYDSRRWADCARMSADALGSVDRLSPAGRVEACRLLCLSSARMDSQIEFQKGISMLRTWADDSWARSNVAFLRGFNARLDGNLPLAETHFRESYRESPGNFSSIRELLQSA